MEELDWMKEDKKKSNILMIIIAIVVLIAGVLLIKNSLTAKQTDIIAYEDNKNLEYKVQLNQNGYYQTDYMEEGNQYIADLIKSIDTRFKYQFDLNEEYEYKYKIIGTVNVKDEKTGRCIYTSSEDLTDEKTGEAKRDIIIEESINIDFVKYNDLIKKFVGSYNLKNVTSTLSIKLDFGIDGVNKEFSKTMGTVMNLDIPLAQNTVAIDKNFDLSNANNFITYNSGKHGIGKSGLVFGIILLVGDAVVALGYVIYNKVNATSEEKYNRNLKKIVNSYDSYISKIDGEFDMEGYQILKVQNFTDLLEIRDTMQLPIMMLENKEQLVTCFVIPTNAQLLYFYSITAKQYALPSGKHKQENMVEKK